MLVTVTLIIASLVSLLFVAAVKETDKVRMLIIILAIALIILAFLNYLNVNRILK